MSTSETQPHLPQLRARHDVTNTLVRYLRAVDDRDVDEVIKELRHATVSFGGPPHRGVEELTRAYREAFASGGRTRHLLHEIDVALDDQVEVDLLGEGTGSAAVATGRAAYQRWSLDTDPPTITALGHYQVHFADDGDQWLLTAMTIHRDWQHTQVPRPPAHAVEHR